MTASPEHTALQAFTRTFGGAPATLAQAPGRVNLIGEHTDYNDGFVLPCAIGYRTVVAARARARADRLVQVVAADQDHAQDSFRLDQPITKSERASWADYVRGLVHTLLANGWQLPGAELAISGNVPQGAGLSSSASLQVALAQVFVQLGATPSAQGAAPKRLAQLAQRAENQFIGVACGIMDQTISACGQAGHALLIDCRSLATHAVPLPDGLAVVIAHSHVKRGLVDSAYNQRRQQCEAAARHFGVPALRDLDEATLHSPARAGLDPQAWQRARHIVTENARTLAAAEALQTGDLRTLGRLMAESHASMRDDFGITTPDVDRLVAIAQQAIGPEGGARMTGGGFGGCIVALLPQAGVPALTAAISQHYRGPEGDAALIWQTQAAAGAGVAVVDRS